MHKCEMRSIRTEPVKSFCQEFFLSPLWRMWRSLNRCVFHANFKHSQWNLGTHLNKETLFFGAHIFCQSCLFSSEPLELHQWLRVKSNQFGFCVGSTILQTDLSRASTNDKAVVTLQHQKLQSSIFLHVWDVVFLNWSKSLFRRNYESEQRLFQSTQWDTCCFLPVSWVSNPSRPAPEAMQIRKVSSCERGTNTQNLITIPHELRQERA